MWSFFLTAFLLVAADQLTKWWIVYHLDIGQSLFKAGFFQIIYGRNSGAAFGLFQGQQLALTIVAILGIGLLLFYAFIIRRQFPSLDSLLTRIALGLALGGITGNLIDRLRFGGVTDFVSVGWWPAFNIADSGIVIGAIIFVYSLLSLARKH
jgi:signal peptidase II